MKKKSVTDRIKQLLFLLIIMSFLGCRREFEVNIVKTKLPEETRNFTSAIKVYKYIIELKKGETSKINNCQLIEFSKIKLTNKIVWIVSHISKNNQHASGLYTLNVPDSVTYFFHNNNLCFIMDIELQISGMDSSYEHFGENEISFDDTYYTLRNTFSTSKEVLKDTLIFVGKGEKATNGKYLRLRKSYLCENSDSGLFINEIKSYSEVDLLDLSELMGIDSYTLIESCNLPEFIKTGDTNAIVTPFILNDIHSE